MPAHQAKGGSPWRVRLSSPLGSCHISKVVRNCFYSPWQGSGSLGHALFCRKNVLSDLVRRNLVVGSQWRAGSPWPCLAKPWSFPTGCSLTCLAFPSLQARCSEKARHGLAWPRLEKLDLWTFWLDSLLSRPRLAMASLSLMFSSFFTL